MKTVILARVMREFDYVHSQVQRFAYVIMLDIGRNQRLRAALFRYFYRIAVHARAAKLCCAADFLFAAETP